MQTVAVIERHLLLWRDPPVWPFLWRGLLPLAVLAAVFIYALGPFAHRSIEAPVAQQMRARLAEGGFGWVEVAVSGQSVRLAGAEPRTGEGERALALARTITCPTWSGERVCATRVTGEFTAAAATAPASAAPAPVTSAAPAVAPAPAARPAMRACEASLAALLAREQIQFAPGSAHIEKKSAPLLDRLAQQVRGCPGTVRIEGYTDSVGRGIVNRHLSEARAAAVRTALIARGVAPTRLKVRGYGEHHPIADNSSEAGRAKNRRIEFHVIGAK
jgi:outer membrane protein OmpA-like peptidoglycan-associated protein